MNWREDRCWAEAAALVRATLDAVDVLLVPQEFLGLDPRCAPLEYGWGLDTATARIGWCCSKDDVDRLAPPLLARAGLAHCRWANEVFVIGTNVAAERPLDEDSRRHVGAWIERLSRYFDGVPARPGRARRVAHTAAAGGSAGGGRPRVLVVGASAMGNVGDDLLAQVLAGLLHEEIGAEVWLSGPDIDPLDVPAYQAVVVGGGGLIYASRHGQDERQNLANYLKFGQLCARAGVPVAMLGVSDQDHAGGIARDAASQAFARRALASFGPVTTRDAASTAFLRGLGAPAAQTGCDLLFAWLERARAAVRPSAPQPPRLALAGELYAYPVFAEGLGDGSGPLAERLRGREFDLLLMSEDDRPHAERARAALRRAGASAAVVDLRDQAFEVLVYIVASYELLITTRFHGLVLAALCDVPVLALDTQEGKSARLLQELSAPGCLLTRETPGAAARDRVVAVLLGDRPRIDPRAVARMAGQSSVHRSAVRALLATARSPSTDPLIMQSTAPGTTPALKSRTDVIHSLRGSVGLCWAASTRDTAGNGNLGDSLSAVVVAALAGHRVHHVNFDANKAKLVAVGSIAHAISRGEAVIWGSGVSIRGGVLAKNVPNTRYDVRAVRGPISARHLRDFGIEVPAVYGDPVWLLPSMFHEPIEKKYELGVIPHLLDVQGHQPDSPPRADSARYMIDAADAGTVRIINTWHEPTWDGVVAKLREILACKRILSQSFHGVVIAETYGIPVLNFRHLPGADSGLLPIDLTADCKTDPRIWEFYKNGRQATFRMYNQRRDVRSDWAAIIDAIDGGWEPFDYDPAPMVEAFPLPLAYDPLRERLPTEEHLKALSL